MLASFQAPTQPPAALQKIKYIELILHCWVPERVVDPCARLCLTTMPPACRMARLSTCMPPACLHAAAGSDTVHLTCMPPACRLHALHPLRRGHSGFLIYLEPLLAKAIW